MPTKTERVVDSECKVGENPLWHPEEERLFWCDIPRGRLHWYDPESDTAGIAHESNERIGGFTIQEDGTFLLFQELGTVRRLDLADGAIDTVVTADPKRFEERFNDVIADPAGRVFAGTMPDPEAGVPGRLYRLDRDAAFATVIDECILPNGMGFTGERETLYFTDSAQTDPETPGRIYRYEYDVATGTISDPDVFVNSSGVDGFPDGLTVDTEDYVWSAFWNGRHAYRFDPTGNRVAAVEFPVRNVSSVAFGGTIRDQLYVTTARVDGRDTEADGEGSLFRIRPRVSGRGEFRSKITV